MANWATVTVIDKHGVRHSIDVKAESTYDAAHLYVCHLKNAHAALLPTAPPIPTVATTFEGSVGLYCPVISVPRPVIDK